MSVKRQYRMAARADAVEETEQRILDAVTEVFWEQPTDQVSLVAVAKRAGVSKQTVLRRFGNKDALLAAAVERAMAEVWAERGVLVEDSSEETGPEEGDDGVGAALIGIVKQLCDHYERAGDGVLRLLAEEIRNPALADIADQGRALHADWCASTFAHSALLGLRGTVRQRRLAQLIAVCDVYTWKLLRRDRGLSRRQTEIALCELLQPLLRVTG